MAITSSWRMIVEVVHGDGRKDKKRERRRRRDRRAPNLTSLGLGLGGGGTRKVGLLDEEAGEAEDDEPPDDCARWLRTSCLMCLLKSVRVEM